MSVNADPTPYGTFRMIDAAIQHAGDHWVVVPNRPDLNVLVINATGREVLRSCDGTVRFEDICEHLASTFGTTTATVRDDVAAFLNEVAAAGIVEREK